VRGAALPKVSDPVRVESEWSRKDRERSNKQERQKRMNECIGEYMRTARVKQYKLGESEMMCRVSAAMRRVTATIRRAWEQ
jgi:hypothetical protein